jgi:hypothetical protein
LTQIVLACQMKVTFAVKFASIPHKPLFMTLPIICGTIFRIRVTIMIVRAVFAHPPYVTLNSHPCCRQSHAGDIQLVVS